MDTRALEKDEILKAHRAAPRMGINTQNSQRMNAMAFLNELSRAVRSSGVSAVDYRAVPLEPSPRDRALWQTCRAWQIVLVPSGKSELFMALELRGDIVIGSNPGSNEGLDVNVSGLDGYGQGVSRRHVLLRPTREKLYLLDLNSTNGTSINGMPATIGRAYTLADGDLFSLGRLHLQLKIARKPEPLT